MSEIGALVNVVIHTVVLLLPIMAIVLLRNLVFDFVQGLFSKSPKKYQKSLKVDLGLVIMFLSVVIGVAVFTAIPTLSIDAAVLIIVGICCLGALILTTGIRAEWEANRLGSR